MIVRRGKQSFKERSVPKLEFGNEKAKQGETAVLQRRPTIAGK